MSSNDEVKNLLKASRWFHEASDDLLNALVDRMAPIECPDGHILVDEDMEMLQVLVLESGTLIRTKYAVEPQKKHAISSSMRDLVSSMRATTLLEKAIVIDKIQGRGRITGLLHILDSGSKAYATVSALGPTKVWSITAEDFRDVISNDPQFALDMMQSMARELRYGSKSLRGLLQNIQKVNGNGQGGDGSSFNLCRVLCYDSSSWVTDGFKPAIEAFNKEHESEGFSIVMEYTTDRLSEKSAVFAAGYDAVCLFVNDTADAEALHVLSRIGVKMVAMRCAGFDRVDVKAARAYGMTVARVPAYSPYAVAEMAVTLLMTVNRKITKAANRVKMANFTLDSGLMGMDIFGKTVGVMGTGKIGALLCNIVLGFGANLICYDVFENDEVKKKGGVYVSKDEIFAQSDVLFLMMPLLPQTHHTINMESVKKLKKGMILINTSRGGLVDTKALIKGLQSGMIGGVGMDVYENEADYFFQDWSARTVKDEDLLSLLGNNKVVLTAHQAFFTKEAVSAIVNTTLTNLWYYKEKGLRGQEHPNNCIPALND